MSDRRIERPASLDTRAEGTTAAAASVPGDPGTVPRLMLDPEQENASRCDAKGILVMAGAGTGKTRTIIDRLDYAVRVRGDDPRSIVVATFTNKAAHEIRERAGLLLGADTAKRMRMGTFHSIGAGILRRHHRAAGLPVNFSVIGEDDTTRLMRDVITVGGHQAAGEDPSQLAAQAIAAIRQWKSWGLTVKAVEDDRRPAREPVEEGLARLYVAYQHEMERRGYVDFGDLCLLPYALMRDDGNIHHAEANGVRHLLVDEAQDANPTQALLARKLSSIHGNVFAVGDVDQSIYSFQGGFSGAIKEIAGPGCATFSLERNRRCTDEILAPAVTLVNRNKRAKTKVLRSGRSGPPAALVQADSERDEGARVLARVKQLAAAGARLSEICVLARSAFALAAVEECLIKAGIPYDMNGGTTFSEREEVRDVIAYLRLAAFPNDALAFERIANRPVRSIGAQALEAILRRQGGQDRPFHEACATLTDLDGVRLSQKHRDGLVGLARGLQALDAGVEDDFTTATLISMILDDRGLGYQAYVASSKDKSRRRRLENLTAMRRLAAEEPEIGGFVDRIMAQSEDVPDSQEYVRLSTMHSSKGLEWDHVICVGFDSAVIPSPRALEVPQGGHAGDCWDGPRGGGMEEERRLAHVAFTRPRMTLDVMLPLTRAGKAVIPSPFLVECGLDPYEDMDPFAPKARMGRKAGSGGSRKGFGR